MRSQLLSNGQTLVDAMYCSSCGSGNLGRFRAEMLIHFPGLKNIDRPPVFVFPELTVCSKCGTAQFVVPLGERCVLAQDLPRQ
jgi:hypothetical protein